MFVIDGLRAPTGLSPLQHVTWAMSVAHPFKDTMLSMDEDLQQCWSFLKTRTVEEIDSQIRQALAQLAKIAADLSGP